MTLFLAMLAAQEEIEQVRVKTAYTLDQGEVEVDLVGSFLRFEDGDLSRFLVEIEAGVTDWLLLEIEVPYLWLNPERGRGERGVGDVELELKGRIPGDWNGIELGIGVEVSLLTGDADEGLGSRETELGAFAAASRRFEFFNVHLQAGVEVAKEVRPAYALAAALDVRPWGDAFSFLLAVNGEIERGEGPAWSLVPGFEVRLDEVQAGLGFPVGLSEEAEDWGVIMDVEIEF
jgi:hypothetical protein